MHELTLTWREDAPRDDPAAMAFGSPDETRLELSTPQRDGGILDLLIRCQQQLADLAALLRQDPEGQAGSC